MIAFPAMRELMRSPDISEQILNAVKSGNSKDIIADVLRKAASFGLKDHKWNVLCALALEKAGYNKLALEYWDRAVRNCPQMISWTENAILLAYKSMGQEIIYEKFFKKWRGLLSGVFSATPSLNVLEILDRQNIGCKGCIGIQSGFLRGWLWLGKNEKLTLKNLGKSDIRCNMHVKGKNAENILYEIKEPIPDNKGLMALDFRLSSGATINGNPVICSSSRTAIQRERNSSSRTDCKGITIVIPVYDDRISVLRCLGSVFASKKYNHQKFTILVLWDCGPDKQLLQALERLHKRAKITLLKAPFNLGFLAGVNFAISHTAGGDIILLNSDTLVHGNWLERMCAHKSSDNIATITALGSQAEHVSFPSRINRGKITSLSQTARLDRACARLNQKEALIDIPVGVGFCMLITREALNRIGGLDGTLLYKGYGEEVDFCLRAAEAGMRNCLAANIFVAHLGGRSFGEAKKALVAQNNVAIKQKFPEYDADYERFLLADPGRELREKISRFACEELSEGHTLCILPWTAQYLPQWQQSEYNARMAALFILPGHHESIACLRVWHELPLEDMKFTIPADIAEIRKIIGDLEFRQIIQRTNSEAVITIAHSILPGHNFIQYQPELLQPLPACSAMPDVKCCVAVPPVTASGWKALCNMAQDRSQTIFYVPMLRKFWGGCARPENIMELADLPDLSPLQISCVLIDPSLQERQIWHEWLECRKFHNQVCYLLAA